MRCLPASQSDYLFNESYFDVRLNKAFTVLSLDQNMVRKADSSGTFNSDRS